MNPVQLFSTVDHGRVHIAEGTQYQGEVSSYNNFFTKLFARLFGWSVDVQIGDKVRRLEKRSYIHFLHEHDNLGPTVSNLSTCFRDLSSVPHTPSQNKGFMWQHLSPEKRESLVRKLVPAIKGADLVRVGHLLGKGAGVNTFFWVRDCDQATVFGDHLSEGLPQRKIPESMGWRVSPLIFAAMRQQTDSAVLLRMFGASATTPGRSCRFSREIVGVQTESHPEPTVRTVVEVRGGRHHGPTGHPGRVGRGGRDRGSHLEVRDQLGVDVVLTQTVSFQDTVQKVEDLWCDGNNQFVRTANPEPPKTYQWDCTDTLARSPIF